MLKRRDAIQMEYEMAHEELSKKKDERDQVRTEPRGAARRPDGLRCPPKSGDSLAVRGEGWPGGGSPIYQHGNRSFGFTPRI